MADFKIEVGGVYEDGNGERQEITKYSPHLGEAYEGFNWWTKDSRSYNDDGKYNINPSSADLVRRIDTPEEKESDIVAVISDELRDELTAIKDEDLPSAADVRGIMKPEDTRPPIPVRAEMDAVCRNGERVWVYGKIAPWGWRSGYTDQYAGDFESRYTTVTNAPVWNADGSHFSDPQFDIVAEYREPVICYLASSAYDIYQARSVDKAKEGFARNYVQEAEQIHKISINPITGKATIERVEEE